MGSIRVVGDGSVDSHKDVVVGDMLKWGIPVGAVGAEECVRACTIIEKCHNLCSSSFNWEALIRDGLVQEDLASVAIFLIVNPQLDQVGEVGVSSHHG